MAFGFAGAGAAAVDERRRQRDELQDLLVQAFKQKQLEQQMALERQAATRADAAQSLREREFTADQTYRTGQVERQATQDRAVENKRGVQRMLGDYLMQRGTQPIDQGARNQITGMAVSEGIDVPRPLLEDPNLAQQNALALEDRRHANDMAEIAARGGEERKTATTRAQGTRDATTQRRITSAASGFGTEPTVRRAQVLAESARFAGGLDPNTKNPSDDQALIYAFAKAMDPESVVREGEYATVQKYSQSLADKYGFDAKRIFSNTQFLTPEARANMKATILERFGAARTSYDALRKSYLDKVTHLGGDEFDLVDYATGFPQTQQSGSSQYQVGQNVTLKDGRTVTIKKINPDGTFEY